MKGQLFDPGLIPNGWTWEFVGDDFVTISAGHKKGWVTVDMLRRSFRAGMSTVGPKLSTGAYTGRGWRDQIIEDAVKWLKGVVAS